MRIIIPDTHKDKKIFQILSTIFNEMDQASVELGRTPDLTCLWDLIDLMITDASNTDKQFIYNLILSQKGLPQVLRSLANYLQFELENYSIRDDKIEMINIKSITTDDISKFLKLFKESLDALLFFSMMAYTIQLIILNLDVVILKNEHTSMIIRSSYNEVTYG